MHKRKIFLFAALVSLVLASIACSLPIISAPSQQSQNQSLDRDDLQVPQQNFDLDLSIVPQRGEEFSYRVTEAQLTSMLREANITGTDLGITNPVLYLRNGQVELQGTGTFSGLKLPLSIKAQLFVDSNQQLQFKINSARLGAFPVPGMILNQITHYIDQSIEQSLAIDTSDIIIESISIENGVLSISGRLRE